MTLIERLLSILASSGYSITNPRPRLNPSLETALEEELVEEVTHGEKEPTPTPELPPNVRLLGKDGQQFNLYILDSALDDGFWGVNAAVIDELRQQPLPWALVLLQGKPDNGYWLNDPNRAPAGGQSLAHDCAARPELRGARSRRPGRGNPFRHPRPSARTCRVDRRSVTIEQGPVELPIEIESG